MKQIIILETNPSDGGLIQVRGLFWIPVPVGQEKPLPNLSQSQYQNATAEEIAALQKGVIIEEVRQFPFPNTADPNQIQMFLLNYYESRIAFLNSLPFSGKLYGMFYDGVNWNGK